MSPSGWTWGVLGSRIFVNNATPGPQRNRVHVDVWVPYDQAEVRIAATLAAGGRLANDTDAPSNWVLAAPRRTRHVSAWPARPDWPPTTRSPGR
ncbi:VOC family protein [Streptomyces lydicus]|uniref:VOC family protein n=1 Tax=Streptomyces lydicus TaxID=47763 RepID=UPI003714CBF1